MKLSICITTFNRGAFIGATLDSILCQTTEDCEVVVLDAASTDDTELVLSQYANRFDCLRYVRQPMNNGIDRDYDRVVDLARGEYSWLMTDDDLLKPGAVAAVMRGLREDLSLIVVNAEVRDFLMSRVLQPRCLSFEQDRVYEPSEMDRLFAEVGDVLKYIGGVVVKREIWLARERERYYGSLFVHVGVIFQDPLPGKALVIVEPLISYRMGNVKTFSPKMFEIIFVKWPSLVRSLAVSDSAKRKVGSAKPWRNFRELLRRRGMGHYSLMEYRKWVRPQLRSIGETLTPALVALFPGVLANALFVLYYSVTRRRYRGIWEPELELQSLRESRFHFRNWRVFRRDSEGA